MLRMADVHAGYGATPILFGVSLEVRAGEAVALLGRKGMGKTTLMKTVMGFLRPRRGVIELDGTDLTRGVAPGLMRSIRDVVSELTRLGVTVLLVEQNARVALAVCDRGYIMEKGSIVFEASSRELRESPVTHEKLGV